MQTQIQAAFWNDKNKITLTFTVCSLSVSFRFGDAADRVKQHLTERLTQS